jgi:hypothetical protein
MDPVKPAHNSKRLITEHLAALTRVVLVNVETGRFPLTVDHHCGWPDLNAITESCTGILELSGAAKYKWDYCKSKWVDVSSFSEEDLANLEAANANYEGLKEMAKHHRKEAEEARRKAGRALNALNTLEQEFLKRVTGAIRDFEEANPAIKLQNLKRLIAEQTVGSVEQVQKELKLQ